MNSGSALALCRRALASSLVIAAVAGAEPAPSVWVPAGEPWDARVRSALIVDPDEPLYFAPAATAARRGSGARHARLPVFAAFRTDGCDRRWLMVGPQAWVCESRVMLSQREPVASATAPSADAGGLPYRYYYAGQAGALGYERLELAEATAPDAELQPGFAVAITRVGEHQGERYGRTTKALWVPLRDLVPARPLVFQGVELNGAPLPIGWCIEERGATVHAAPAGRRREGESLVGFERFDVLERTARGGQTWFRIGEERWVESGGVRVASEASPPTGLTPRERWIDVDLESQTLVAYEGAQPVYATLVSSGRGPPGSELATPIGEHRIWVKLRTADMDNLEDEEASRYYAIQDVPWVMFFAKGYGLHGTFWHRSFGHVRSHGCVNLAPLDAQWLFYWTSPRVPAGWAAALPSRYDPGTRVRVR